MLHIKPANSWSVFTSLHIHACAFGCICVYIFVWVYVSIFLCVSVYFCVILYARMWVYVYACLHLRDPSIWSYGSIDSAGVRISRYTGAFGHWLGFPLGCLCIFPISRVAILACREFKHTIQYIHICDKVLVFLPHTSTWSVWLHVHWRLHT